MVEIYGYAAKILSMAKKSENGNGLDLEPFSRGEWDRLLESNFDSFDAGNHGRFSESELLTYERVETGEADGGWPESVILVTPKALEGALKIEFSNNQLRIGDNNSEEEPWWLTEVKLQPTEADPLMTVAEKNGRNGWISSGYILTVGQPADSTTISELMEKSDRLLIMVGMCGKRQGFNTRYSAVVNKQPKE